MRSGKGVMMYAACGERYEGEWSDDKRNGKGSLFFGTCGETFRGTWSNDKKETGAYYDCQGNVVCSFKDEPNNFSNLERVSFRFKNFF